MTHDNEAIIRHAYHAAEGNVLDVAEFVGSFAEDGVFNDVVGQEGYRGEQLGDVVLRMAKLLPDVHRELHRVTVLGDTVAVELSIQGTFRGSLETPAGIVQPTGAKIDVPTADFWYLRDGKIETFNCYVGYSTMFAQMGLPPDFGVGVGRARSRDRGAGMSATETSALPDYAPVARSSLRPRPERAELLRRPRRADPLPREETVADVVEIVLTERLLKA